MWTACTVYLNPVPSMQAENKEKYKSDRMETTEHLRLQLINLKWCRPFQGSAVKNNEIESIDRSLLRMAKWYESGPSDCPISIDSEGIPVVWCGRKELCRAVYCTLKQDGGLEGCFMQMCSIKVRQSTLCYYCIMKSDSFNGAFPQCQKNSSGPEGDCISHTITRSVFEVTLQKMSPTLWIHLWLYPKKENVTLWLWNGASSGISGIALHMHLIMCVSLLKLIHMHWFS